MTGSFNSLKYTRVDSDGIYYSDLKKSLRRSVKFDVFDNNDQLATLVTNNKTTYTLTKSNINPSIRCKWNWLNKWRYFISENTDDHIATIYVHKPILWAWFRPNVYSITFQKTNLTYHLKAGRRKERKYTDADFYYDLILNGETRCSIINFKKTKGFRLATTDEHEGIIEYGNGINIKDILCFLQLMNIHIDLEFDG